MERSKSVLFTMKPFGYISNNKKAFLSYFIDQENLKKDNSVAISYYNTSFYRELILLLCFSTVEKNIGHFRSLDMNFLYEGAPLIYIGKSAHYKDHYFKYEGVNEKNGNIIVRPLKNTKVTGDTHEYPELVFKKNFSLTEIDIDVFSKKRKFIDVRDKFAKLFGIEKINRINHETTVILASKKLIDEIIDSTFKINGQTFNLKEVCNFNYLKSTGELVPCSSSATVEKSMVIFSSHIFSLIDYLEDVYDNSNNLIVNVIEEKWIKKAQISNLYSLKDVCKKEKIPLRVATSINSMLNDEVLDLFTDFTSTNIWENRELFKETNPVIMVKLISCNKQFSDAFAFFDNYLSSIKGENSLLFFDKLLKKYLKMIFSQINDNSLAVEEFMNKLSEYGEEIQVPNLNDFHQVVFNIFDNRFGNKMKKTLDKMLNCNEQIALVVVEEMSYEVKEYYSNFRNITVYSLSTEITEDIYDKYSKVIIISPSANERRRWMYSGLEIPVYFLVPEVQSKYLRYSLKKDLKSFNTLKGMNSFGTSPLIQNYEEAVRIILDSTVWYDNTKKNIDPSCFEEVENGGIDGEEVVQERFERMLEIVDKDDFHFTPIINHNTFVTVTYGIDLVSGNHILGTSRGKVFILDSQKTCREIFISQLKINHEIIDFSIPYSDEFYRRNLKFLLENNLLNYEVETPEYLDVYWKMKLIDYVDEKRLTVKQIKEKIEAKGYKKRSENFYLSWIEIDKLRIKPHDESFIKYVGEVVGDVSLIRNPEKYYSASEVVKRSLYKVREETLNSFNGKTIAEVSKQKIIDSYTIEKILNIEKIEIEEVRRVMTNRVLRRTLESDC